MNLPSIILLIVIVVVFGGICFHLITRKKSRSCDNCSLHGWCKLKKKD